MFNTAITTSGFESRNCFRCRPASEVAEFDHTEVSDLENLLLTFEITFLSVLQPEATRGQVYRSWLRAFKAIIQHMEWSKEHVKNRVNTNLILRKILTGAGFMKSIA
jgi:hypothetical protein